MSSRTRAKTIASLQDREYRNLYVAEHMHQGFAFQIRTTRKARGWTQEELAEHAGMKQSRISQVEDPSYENLSLNSVKRIAEALDVALILRIVPYSQFVDFLAASTPISSDEWVMPVPSFDDDAELTRETPEATVPVPLRPGAPMTFYQSQFRIEDSTTRSIVDIRDYMSAPIRPSAITGRVITHGARTSSHRG